MKTTTYRHGRVVIPATIRAKYNIKVGNRLVWIDNGETIRIIPIPPDPIAALYGRGKGQDLAQKLLEERANDRHSRSE